MSQISEAIDVHVPVRTAYDQWTMFEEFPRFMEGVERVEQRGDRRMHWVAEIAGQHREWDAEVTEQIPDERVAWTSTSGARNAGVVTFHRLEPDVTRVMLQLDFEPEGALESVGDALGVVKLRVKGDLERFRSFVEERGVETGAWRGEIRQDATSGTAERGVAAGMGTVAGAVGAGTGMGTDPGLVTGVGMGDGDTSGAGGLSGEGVDEALGIMGTGSVDEIELGMDDGDGELSTG